MQWYETQNYSAGVKLNDILADAQSVGCYQSQSEFVVRSACGRWDECESGDLFFAIDEGEFDGHDYIDEAVKRGARGVVCERLLPQKIQQFIVKDSRIAYGQVCQALSGNPSQRIKLIGVTGSLGKTVTSHLLHSILQADGRRTGLSSSIETRCSDSHRQSPEPIHAPSFANQLAKMCIGKCSDAVVEMPSHALAQRTYSGVRLDAAILTNVQPTNLSLHGNLRNCQRAHFRVLDHLKPSGFAVVNADDKNSRELLNSANVPMLTFGIHNAAEVTAKILERNSQFQTIVVSAGSDSIPIRTHFIGKQHIYHCLAAATAALTMGIDLQAIAAGIEAAKIPGRMQRVDCGQAFGVWVDSTVSPHQLNNAISAVAPVCEGRIWCVCSTTAEQSPEQRRQIGEILERKIEKPIITQLAPTGKTIDYEPCHQVLDGFSKPELAHVMPDRKNAIEWALTHAKPKDAVLLLGAGEKAMGPYGKGSMKLTDVDICQSVLCRQGTKWNAMTSEIYRIDDYR